MRCYAVTGQKGLRLLTKHAFTCDSYHLPIDASEPCCRFNESGPFDLIGDVHGCYHELCSLLRQLGYQVEQQNYTALPPQGRTSVFLGDLCDRGPYPVETLRLAMNMERTGNAIFVTGNHDDALFRRLNGKSAPGIRGVDETVSIIEAMPDTNIFSREVSNFLEQGKSHYVLDEGRLIAAHAGQKEEYHGQQSVASKEFALNGEITGGLDEFGLPVILDWSRNYTGKAFVVYGHIAKLEAEIHNNTICIDTGCVYGSKLTALRYPERQIISVQSEKTYYKPNKPLI